MPVGEVDEAALCRLVGKDGAEASQGQPLEEGAEARVGASKAPSCSKNSSVGQSPGFLKT